VLIPLMFEHYYYRVTQFGIGTALVGVPTTEDLLGAAC
jgi:hypothetical protein